MIENWRFWIIILLLGLSVIDIAATYVYVSKYKTWQPDKPYKLIENNPLLVFLWNMFGLTLGTIIGAVIIWSLIYIIGKTAHPIVIGILILFLGFALFNHYKNLGLLDRLIEKFPTGHLPEKIFGKVIGNNK